jgi:hypothetical protein
VQVTTVAGHLLQALEAGGGVDLQRLCKQVPAVQLTAKMWQVLTTATSAAGVDVVNDAKPLVGEIITGCFRAIGVEVGSASALVTLICVLFCVAL